MSTTTSTDPITYTVFNGADEPVETADTQLAAFRLIDWYTVHEPAAGPYSTRLTLAG